jgi:hypothetical protein
MGTPINPKQGEIVAYNNLTPGTGYTPVASDTYYFGPFFQGIATTSSGSGTGANPEIEVNGATGQVVALYFGLLTGLHYAVNDTLTSTNALIGKVGSGWQATVNSVGENGTISTFTVNLGGSNYVANTFTYGSGGTGTGEDLFVSIGPFGCSGAACVVTAMYPAQSYGYGYCAAAGVGLNCTGTDTITVPGLSDTTPASAKVATVINNTFTNNTYKAADCNGLASANGNQFGYSEVASVIAPSANPTPPTDVIGSYFASLAYGYQGTVPTILSGQTSAYEQGFIAAASLQQKANWDTNLTAHALMNWARPQFGMANPY